MIYRNLSLLLLMVVAIAIFILKAQNTGPEAMVMPMDTRLRAHPVPTLDSETSFFLDPGTTLDIIGRTADQAWVQVYAEEVGEGWVLSEFIMVFIDLPPIPITTDLGALSRGYALPPDVVEQLKAIYQHGQELGNRPNVFSKVGDSITESPHYLKPISRGLYNLGDFQYLQGVIDYFSSETARDADSFSNTSIAAGTGWSSDAVLKARFADPSLCSPGEMPLACEYRIVRPSIALIMFGTNDTGHFDAITYEYKLQQIIEYSIEQGVIPILSTIPVRLGYEEKSARFNEVVIKNTGLYHIPLWDYGATLATLPGYGLDTDGIHPSLPAGGLKGAVDFRAVNLYSGYVLRNLTALQMLDLVWQTIN
jgi:hypothetical protein